MPRHSRKISPQRSRQLSRNADDFTLGAHHRPRSAAAHSRRTRAGRPDELAPLSRRGATYVEAVSPSTSSAESANAYSRRMRSGDYVEQSQRQDRRRRRTWVIALVVVVAALALGVGAFTYFTTMNAHLNLDDGTVDAALAPVDEGPFYALCAAELGTAVNDADPTGDAYQLVRVDIANRQLTFVDVPSSIVVTAQNNETMPLYAVRETLGNGALIEAVAALASVDISEFALTNADGIRSMADAAGGVGFDVTEMIDDPRASTIVLNAGEAKLNGEQALLVLRAANFKKPFEQRAYNRCVFTMQLANQLLSLHGSAQAIADVSPGVSASADASELLALADDLGDLTTLTIYSAVVPGSYSNDSGRYSVSTGAWTKMMEAVDAGRAPDTTGAVDTSLDPASLTIEVRNGGGITGAAAAVAEILEGQGYKVLSVGNMDDAATYTETFVVYRDAAYERAANVVQSQIGLGRVINGGDFYSFGTNLLVVVGSDYVAAD